MMTDSLSRWLQSSQSTLFTRLDPDLRRRLNLALLDRHSGGYHALYERFALRDHGISFSSFYRYGRRIRDWGIFNENAAWTAVLDNRFTSCVPAALARWLIATLACEDITPLNIQRITTAYLKSIQSLPRRNAAPVPLSPAFDPSRLADAPERNPLLPARREGGPCGERSPQQPGGRVGEKTLQMPFPPPQQAVAQSASDPNEPAPDDLESPQCR